MLFRLGNRPQMRSCIDVSISDGGVVGNKADRARPQSTLPTLSMVDLLGLYLNENVYSAAPH
jgi:hypothetical protein